MCGNCKNKGIGRRDLFKLGAAGAIALGLGASGPALAAEGEATALSPDQALAALKSGNERYVEQSAAVLGRSRASRRTAVAAHQAPWATIISCADSRVPPELIFGGHGVGELFVARNAGNLVDTATLGTVEYGAAVLGSPLIVVLAHTSCGAVKAACDVVTKNATYPGAIGPMIEPIVPAALAVRERGRRFRQQRRQGKRQAHRRATEGGELDHHRPRGLGQAQDRRGDIRSRNRRRHISGLRERVRPCRACRAWSP